MRRREAKNRPERPQGSPETERVERYRRKSPQKRPIGSRRRDLRFRRTGWWCAQSDANRSPPNISLFSGNLTGDSAIFRPLEAFCIRETAVLQWFFAKFPKKTNRVKLSDNRDRNRTNSEIQSGYQEASISHTLVSSGRGPRSVHTGKVAGNKDGDVERDRLTDTRRPGVLACAS
jgi:hypothetical protein